MLKQIKYMEKLKHKSNKEYIYIIYLYEKYLPLLNKN